MEGDSDVARPDIEVPSGFGVWPTHALMTMRNMRNGHRRVLSSEVYCLSRPGLRLDYRLGTKPQNQSF